MEAHIESLIEAYLTSGGSVFVCPQYEVAWDKEAADGGTCPDFVALDYVEKHVVIVEVTTSWNLDAIAKKIDQREQGWFRPIMRRLSALGAVTTEWKPRFLGFVRNDRLAHIRARFDGASDVGFYPVEEAILGYAYWEDRKVGLPSNRPKRDPSA